MTIKIGINGFGRIGRNVCRGLFESKKHDIEIVAINDLTDAKTLSHLLKYDSTHGRFAADVKCNDNSFSVDGHEIKVLAERDPANLPWGDLGVDIVIESTGLFTQKEKAEAHIKAGAKKVLISAPGKGEMPTIVYGVNDDTLTAADTVISNASCTTNCLAPVAKILHDEFGIKHGLMTTVHSYTNDQRILDLPHSDLYRARAAALNMIPTSTGAAKAIGLVIPELKGKLDGFAIRVPTPNVSVVDLTVNLNKPASKEAINNAMKSAAAGPLKGVLDYTDEELVSSDFNHCPASSTFHGPQTIVMDDNFVKIVTWYDNEWGFSNRLLDMVAKISSL